MKLLVIELKKVKGMVWRSPLCKFNSQCFFTDKNNFFQVKMYSGLFSDCHVQPNVWKDCKGKYYFSLSFKFQEFSRASKVLLFLTLSKARD